MPDANQRKSIRSAVVQQLKDNGLSPVQNSPYAPKPPNKQSPFYAVYARSETLSSNIQETMGQTFRTLNIEIVCWVPGTSNYADQLDDAGVRIEAAVTKNSSFGVANVIRTTFQQFQSDPPETAGETPYCMGRWVYQIDYLT